MRKFRAEYEIKSFLKRHEFKVISMQISRTLRLRNKPFLVCVGTFQWMSRGLVRNDSTESKSVRRRGALRLAMRTCGDTSSSSACATMRTTASDRTKEQVVAVEHGTCAQNSYFTHDSSRLGHSYGSVNFRAIILRNDLERHRVRLTVPRFVGFRLQR